MKYKLGDLIMISLTKDYYEYLKDESRKAGKADSISFPCSEEEIIDMIVSLNKNNTKVTIQGARTGITARQFRKKDIYLI